MKVVGRVVEGVVIMRDQARDWVSQASDVTKFRNEAMEADAEMAHDDLGFLLLDAGSKFWCEWAVRVMKDCDPLPGILMGNDFVKSRARGFRDVHKGQHWMKCLRVCRVRERTGHFARFP